MILSRAPMKFDDAKKTARLHVAILNIRPVNSGRKMAKKMYILGEILLFLGLRCGEGHFYTTSRTKLRHLTYILHFFCGILDN